MDFFNSHDWLNRGGYNYLFKFDHIIYLIIAVLVAVGLCFLLYKKDKNTVKKTLIIIWICAVALTVVYYGEQYIHCLIDPDKYPFVLETMLPLHSCLMFMYLFPVAMFTKNQIIRTAANSFIVVINMTIGFVTMFVGCPLLGYSTLSFTGLQSLLLHTVIFIVPLIMLVTGLYELKIKDLYYGLGLFAILALAAWIFDAITGCDYFYHYDGHTFPAFEFISQNVHHLVWTFIVVACYIITGIATHFVIIGITYLINKQKEKKQNEPQLS